MNQQPRVAQILKQEVVSGHLWEIIANRKTILDTIQLLTTFLCFRFTVNTLSR